MLFVLVKVLQDTAQFNNVQPGDQHKFERTAASRVQEIKPATLIMEQKSFEKSVAKVNFIFIKHIEGKSSFTVYSVFCFTVTASFLITAFSWYSQNNF